MPSVLAANIGFHYSTEPIAALVAAVRGAAAASPDLAAENVQARVRGIILMALSNIAGHLVLTTGNKTELSVGYSTIYGDSAGGFAPDQGCAEDAGVGARALAQRARGIDGATLRPIPVNSIEKPPSAELRPDQTDQDTLPPYEVLDAILDAYVTRNLGREDVIALGFDAETVDFVTRLVDRSEWKRRQGAIGPKISGMAFGRDRRLPITYRPTN